MDVLKPVRFGLMSTLSLSIVGGIYSCERFNKYSFDTVSPEAKQYEVARAIDFKYNNATIGVGMLATGLTSLVALSILPKGKKS